MRYLLLAIAWNAETFQNRIKNNNNEKLYKDIFTSSSDTCQSAVYASGVGSKIV